MKIDREDIAPDQGSSFKVRLTPQLNDRFFWHRHPEYEIVYVEGVSGTRYVGKHISRYQDGDLVFIGPYIPHLNFDFGVPAHCEQVIIQMKEDFLGQDFLNVLELAAIKALFKKAAYGLSFTGTVKKAVGDRLKKMSSLQPFEKLLSLLEILQCLAVTEEVVALHSEPVIHGAFEKERQRMEAIYKYIEARYASDPDVNEVAQKTHLSTPAFCRFFKKYAKMSFTDFVNRYRIHQAQNLLLQGKGVSESCYAIGFNNLSYFNKLFKKITGENPSGFRRKHSSL